MSRDVGKVEVENGAIYVREFFGGKRGPCVALVIYAPDQSPAMTPDQVGELTALLNSWSNGVRLEPYRQALGLCPVCGHPLNSASCQAQHP